MSNKNSKEKPLLSVIMPVFNAAEFLGEAVESILNQSFQNFDFIIVDDGSTDNSWKIIKFYQERDPEKIEAYRFSRNKGESVAANFAFEKSQGEFIARMDADDIAYPQRLEKQVEFLLKNPQVVVVGTQAEVIEREGEKIGEKKFPLTHQEIYREFAVFHPLLHPSCMFRKKLLPSQKYLYENKFEPNDEYYTFFKLLNYGFFANLPQSLLKYRVHGKNKSLKNPKAKFINSLRIRVAAVKDLGYRPTLKAIFLIFLQVVVIGFLPEKAIVPLYMLARGMCSPANFLPKWQSVYEKKLAFDSYSSS